MQRRCALLLLCLAAGFGVPGLKVALQLVAGYGGAPRLPLLPVSETERERLRSLLVGASLLGAGSA